MTDQQDLRARLILRAAEAAMVGGYKLANLLREAAAQLGRVDENSVGCLTISRWKGADSMVNHDFDYYGSLPDGSYSLYTRPQLPAGVPDSWKLVPVEPTDDMLEAYQEAMCGLRNMTSVDDNELVILWSAMLAAAPQPDNKESR